MRCTVCVPISPDFRARRQKLSLKTERYKYIRWLRKANSNKNKINKKCVWEDGREEMKIFSFIIALIRELMSATIFM